MATERDNYTTSNLSRNVVPEEHRLFIAREKAAEDESRRQFEAWRLDELQERSQSPLAGLVRVIDRSGGGGPFGS